MKTKHEKLQQIKSLIRKLFPTDHVSITLDRQDNIDISYHGCPTYSSAVAWLREWGVGDRDKHVYDTYTALTGKNEHGVRFATFPDELPPTCRKVEYVERIPKTETVTTDEFVEVKRTKIVCGSEAEHAN